MRLKEFTSLSAIIMGGLGIAAIVLASPLLGIACMLRYLGWL